METQPKNRLLAALPRGEWPRIRDLIEPIALVQGDELIEPGERFTHAFFPEEGIVSLVATLESGSAIEMAATGREGMVSVNAALGGVTAMHRKVVQVPGSAYRVRLNVLNALCRTFPSFRDSMLTYAQVYLAQVLQTVACSGIHTLEERCARLLLMCHDRSERNRFPLTQEFMAELLGASRPSVNRACKTLQSSGAIRQSQGMVTVADRKRLEAAACECYSAIRRQFDRLLPGSFAH
jgi:CRP-like cAMP-binding protein